MHRYSPAARRLVQRIRWNSTVETAPKTDTPARDSTAFTPNVEASAMPPGSLAARLSQKTAQSVPANTVASTTTLPPSTVISSSSTDDEAAAAIARRRELLLARRAEREAREAAASKYSSPRSFSQPRPPNQDRPRSFEPRTQPERTAPAIVGGPASRTAETSRGMRGRGDGRGGRGGRGGGRGSGRGGGRSRPAREEMLEEFPPEIDEWLETPGISFASELAAEIGGVGPLDEALQPEASLETPKSNRRVVREELGGDYSHFVPTNPQEFLSAAGKLGAEKHSAVVLTYNKDLPVVDRFQLQRLVKTSAQPVKSK
ncbi:hypothetical protein FB45DRAFT_325099 [Roridomyces roridus]|uniref:Uncharacterized protein n=1 Tax=Roridomyces roridus TaxID=1738132 RepID=A0AAD7B5U6_9AGAR|nr:hypothetical protein FB45DRAFT_325099 [Roridomyces roridus]